MLLACICGGKSYFITCNIIVISQMIKFKMDVVIVIGSSAQTVARGAGREEVPLGESSRLHSGAQIVTTRWTDHGRLKKTFDSILSMQRTQYGTKLTQQT